MAAEGTAFCFEWEVRLMVWLQAHLGDAALAVISQLSLFGEQMLLIVILGFLYWCYDKKYGKYVGMSLLAANVWNPMVKNIFLRRRPYFDHPDINILRVVEPEADIYDIAAQGYSFPSGHSTCAAATYGGIARYGKRRLLTALAFILPLLVGVSRVTVGAHYPTDVLAGWLLGALAIFIVPALQGKIKNRGLFYLIILITCLPGLFYCRSEDYFTSLGMLIGFMIAVPFEERFVRFENTRSPIRCLLRILGGGAGYVLLNTVLKMPFSAEFLGSGSMPALLVRLVRYAVILFILLAVYPMIFSKGKKEEKV